MTIRERRAKSVRRQRLEIIEEGNEDVDLQEVVFEPESFLRNSIEREKLNGEEMKMLTKSTKEKSCTVDRNQKLLVRMLGNINIYNENNNNRYNSNTKNHKLPTVFNIFI